MGWTVRKTNSKINNNQGIILWLNKQKQSLEKELESQEMRQNSLLFFTISWEHIRRLLILWADALMLSVSGSKYYRRNPHLYSSNIFQKLKPFQYFHNHITKCKKEKETNSNKRRNQEEAL